MHGKRLKLKQKKQLKYIGLNYENWLVQQDTPEFIRIVHKISGKEKIIPKHLFCGMEKKEKKEGRPHGKRY